MAQQDLTIDPREHERLLQFCEDYAIFANFPHLELQAKMINTEHPSSLDRRVYESFKTSLDHLIAFHDEVPIPTAPPGLLEEGRFHIARQYANQRPLTLRDEELPHLLVFGRTGAGKSTFIGPLTKQAINAGLRVAVLDLKFDMPWLQQHPGTIVIDSDTKIAPLRRDPSLSPSEHASTIIADYNEFFWGAAGQTAAILGPLERVLKNHTAPSLADWQEEIRRGPKTDATRAAVERLETIRLEYPGMFYAREDSIPLDTVHEHSLYLAPRAGLTPATRFVFWHLLHRRFKYLLHQEHRNHLHTIVVLDEGNMTLTRRLGQATVTGMQPLPMTLVTQGREPGLAFIICTSSWTEIDPLVRANIFLKVILTPGEGREADAITEALRLTPDQNRFLTTKLSRGTAILSYPTWPHPVLATFDRFDQPKTITPEDRRAAKERTASLATTIPAPQVVAATETKGVRQATLSPAPPSTKAPAASKTAKIALNTTEQALLDYLATHPVSLTTELQHDLQLHPQTFARLAKKLDGLGWITRTTIRCRSGRGSSAVALTLTPTGAARTTKKHAHQSRGGDSVQHRYLATRLAARIPRAQLETTIGTKSIDILIPYNNDDHEHLVREHATALNNGDLVAIEIEASDPKKTIPNNVEKNTAAGITLTIIAVLPRTLHAAQQVVHSLPPDLRQRAIVADALKLLDTYREEKQ